MFGFTFPIKRVKIMNWYKKAQQIFPSTLTSEEMENFILNNSLRDWSGKLEYQDAHDIAHRVDQWVLTEIPLKESTLNPY